MILFPSESFILGLFILAAVFLVIGVFYHVAGTYFVTCDVLSNSGICTYTSRTNFYKRIGLILAVLAIVAGVWSSLMPISPDVFIE
jgi:quinol-cytochrome oxidoreductase complex cytochrome b subunit